MGLCCPLVFEPLNLKSFSTIFFFTLSLVCSLSDPPYPMDRPWPYVLGRSFLPVPFFCDLFSFDLFFLLPALPPPPLVRLPFPYCQFFLLSIFLPEFFFFPVSSVFFSRRFYIFLPPPWFVMSLSFRFFFIPVFRTPLFSLGRFIEENLPKGSFFLFGDLYRILLPILGRSQKDPGFGSLQKEDSLLSPPFEDFFPFWSFFIFFFALLL